MNAESTDYSEQLDAIDSALHEIAHQLELTRKAMFFARPKGWEDDGYYEGVEEDDWLEENNIVASLTRMRYNIEEINDFIKDLTNKQAGPYEERSALDSLERKLGSIGSHLRSLTTAITVLVIVFIIKLIIE